MSRDSSHHNPRQHGTYWLVLGLVCGLALATVMPQPVLVRPPFREVPLLYVDMWRWQQTTSHLFWFSMIGVAIGAVVDLVSKPPESLRFRFSLRTLLLFAATVAMFLSACSLYVRIMAIRP